MAWLQKLIFLAGLGQLALAAGSLLIPKVLHWREELSYLKTSLIRQIFWVYSAYIWSTNLGFGLLSALAPHWLLADCPLAVVLASYIAVYWASRLLIQFFYFDRSAAPSGFFFRLAEWSLVLLFAFLAIVYGAAALSYFF